MDGGVRHVAFALDQIGHAPRRPETGPIPEGLRTALQPSLDPTQIVTRQLRRAPCPWRALQRVPSALGELLRPPIHRLAMDPDAPGDFGFADALFEEPRPLQTAALQLHPIAFDAGWLSHAGEHSRFTRRCHYVM